MFAELRAEDRAALRLAIDRRQRERCRMPQVARCSECAMSLDDLTPGCVTCWDRHRRRAGRQRETRNRADSRQLLRVVRARFYEQSSVDTARRVGRSENAGWWGNR